MLLSVRKVPLGPQESLDFNSGTGIGQSAAHDPSSKKCDLVRVVGLYEKVIKVKADVAAVLV
jgi:hypothetical protein